MWAAIFNIIAGIWIMITPALFAFEKAEADYNYIIGPLAITCAIVALWELNRSARFFTLLSGIALIASPLFFQSTEAIWNNVVAGVVMVLLSLVKGKIKGHYGGGWKSLFQHEPEHWREANIDSEHTI